MKTVYNSKPNPADSVRGEQHRMGGMFGLLWHVWVLGHSVRTNRHVTGVSSRLFKGWLHVCECGLAVAR